MSQLILLVEANLDIVAASVTTARAARLRGFRGGRLRETCRGTMLLEHAI